MPPCLQLQRSGRPCPNEAVEGSFFCLRHRQGARELPWDSLRRWLFRLAAVLLLAALLLPLAVQGYRMIREFLN